ncbi:MAG: hypothetical protein ACTSR6_03985 [Candidatus Heimdallarchaeota archaeon]
MSKEDEIPLKISITPIKTGIKFPAYKRCSICKKKAHIRIRHRDLDNNTTIQNWTYYCNRHGKQAHETVIKQANKYDELYEKLLTKER